jgi:Na+-driven multidrug efflux pump
MDSPALTPRRELDRRIISLAIPALGTLAIEPLYVLVDTAIVGRLGTPQLGGVAIAMTILLTVISLTASLEYGVTPDVAFAHGADRSAEARDVAAGALRLAVMIGVPMGAIVAAAAQPLAWLLGGRGEVLDYAVTYLRISCVGLPFVLIAYVGHGVMRGVNDLRKPLQIVLIANLVNLVAEIVAVYWLDLGVAGSAWSTVLVQVGAAMVFLRVLRPHRAGGRPSSERMRRLLRSGVHFAVRSMRCSVWNMFTHVRKDTPMRREPFDQPAPVMALMLDALAIRAIVAPVRSARATERGVARRPNQQATLAVVRCWRSDWPRSATCPMCSASDVCTLA